ncbi:MAG: type II toxin-antitoxin system RelE/ParE family toxin [Chitinophagaceae bacterium]|jgi:plasmid stabilization system protein ParE|nr:type II toxin-antitoxin system RelE/ParE family toxin [Chitinophagaceae bacterium]
MVYKIIYTPLALIDTDETAEWYNHEMPGLGKRFLLDLAATINIINNNPFTFSLLDTNIRRAGLRKFPFVILYFIEEKEVHVLAVVSTKRSKRFIKRRLKKRY